MPSLRVKSKEWIRSLTAKNGEWYSAESMGSGQIRKVLSLVSDFELFLKRSREFLIEIHALCISMQLRQRLPNDKFRFYSSHFVKTFGVWNET